MINKGNQGSRSSNHLSWDYINELYFFLFNLKIFTIFFFWAKKRIHINNFIFHLKFCFSSLLFLYDLFIWGLQKPVIIYFCVKRKICNQTNVWAFRRSDRTNP